MQADVDWISLQPACPENNLCRKAIYINVTTGTFYKSLFIVCSLKHALFRSSFFSIIYYRAKRNHVWTASLFTSAHLHPPASFAQAADRDLTDRKQPKLSKERKA
jgi:hypothetical protein